MSRALRRHHRARVIAKARRLRRRWFNSWEPDQWEWVRGRGRVPDRVYVRRRADHTVADAHAVKYADHLAVCSCVSCGNPRRFGGSHAPVLTRQERVAELQLREQLDEVLLDGEENDPGERA